MKIVITNKGLSNENEDLNASMDAEKTVYEVIRVIDGVAIFLEDHHQRLLKSIALQKLDFQISFEMFRRNIEELIAQNKQFEGNIRFVCAPVGSEVQWRYGFIPHNYPSESDYSNGVVADLLIAERNNPNAKVIQTDVRDRANRLMATRSLFEVLLVNQDKLITEGSRSNVFFVRPEAIYTAPSSLVLEGITRMKVIGCISHLPVRLVEQAVGCDQLSEFDSAFISGTSPKILPLRSIGNYKFNVHNRMVRELMALYNRTIEDYVSDRKAMN